MNKGVTVHLISTRINANGSVSRADIEEARRKKDFRSLVAGDIFAVMSESDIDTSRGVARTIFGNDPIVTIHRKAAADLLIGAMTEREKSSVVMVSNPQDAKLILQKICKDLMDYDHEKRDEGLSKIEAILGHLLDGADTELTHFRFPDEDEEDRGLEITPSGITQTAPITN